MDKQRIKELADHAGMTRILDEHAHEYGNGQFENTQYPELEKFAELIVKECSQHLTNIGADWAREQLERHFGVE